MNTIDETKAAIEGLPRHQMNEPARWLSALWPSPRSCNNGTGTFGALPMPTYKFDGQIAEDHTLELPHDIPTGWAEIVITTDASRGTYAAIDAVLRELDKAKPRNRSKEEIDSYLRTEREAWE